MLPLVLRKVFPVVGVIHVAPLPGAPRARRGFESVLEAALADGAAFAEAGVDALLVENYGDAPFEKAAAPPHVTAFLAILARELGARHGLPLGINVLRNDGASALGAAAAAGAAFLRVNVLIGVSATDQGIIEGCAAELLRYRRALGADVAILADVAVKHATPLFAPSLGELAQATLERGMADGLIVTGTATGQAPLVANLAEVRAAVPPEVPVFIGSGATVGNLAEIAGHASGVIVGSACKRGGRAGEPVDPVRARAFVESAVAVRRFLPETPPDQAAPTG